MDGAGHHDARDPRSGLDAIVSDPASANPQPEPWRVVQSEEIVDCRIFKVRRDRVVHPRSQETHEMFVLAQPDWVNVIPLTANDEVVMVRQWRHGTRTVELETPGGLIDGGESPLDAGRRELLEETGYQADHISVIGEGYPNPAFQSNRQYYVLATGCKPIGAPALDTAEDVAVEIIPLKSVPDLIRTGRIQHLIVVAAFQLLDLRR